MPQHPLEGGQPLGPGQADGAGDGPGGRAQRPAGGHQPLGGAGAGPAAAARQRAQEADGLGGRDLGAQVEAGGDHLGLGEAAQPAVRQRDLLLHDGAVEGGDLQRVGPDGEVQRVGGADPAERLAQRVVHVHVGGAVPDVVAVQAGGEDVQAGVDAAAAGERLEAQPVAVGGDHRVERGAQQRLVVAGGRDVGDGQQRGRGRRGGGEEAAEEARVRGGTVGGGTARGLQGEAAAGGVLVDGGRTEVGVRLYGLRHVRNVRAEH